MQICHFCRFRQNGPFLTGDKNRFTKNTVCATPKERLFSRNSTRKLIDAAIFTSIPCDSTCLCNAPSMHTVDMRADFKEAGDKMNSPKTPFWMMTSLNERPKTHPIADEGPSKSRLRASFGSCSSLLPTKQLFPCQLSLPCFLKGR